MTRSGRPQRGEYADDAQSDFDFIAGDDAVEALERSRDAAIALFQSAPDAKPYAPGKWTVKQVLGHLIDDERIFAYRALCVARGEPRELPGFDEKLYVSTAGFDERSSADLLREYETVREATIALCRGLTDEQWMRRGIVNGYEASVRGLAFHIAAHEQHHLRIVRERYLAQ
ncbi:MAG TPA: DinB family protein [Thermoanaerobaculia bacterium]|nr:DinB family protein [Thermoanaerobaculia bacterium]